MDLDASFATDETVAAAVGSRIHLGEADARFALIDLGGGLANGPPGLTAALLRFRGRQSMDADDEHTRQLAVVDFIGPEEATIVGCARLAVDVAPGDSRQVSMSHFVVRHDEAQARRWIHAWLAAEFLRVATQLRLPHAYAAVGSRTVNALAEIGVVFQRIERPASPHANGLIRVNTLASERRVRLDHRIPKLAVTAWPDSRS